MKLTGWGKYPIINAQGRSFENFAELRAHLAQPEDCIVYGRGRSYGDSALNERVIFSRRFNKILAFDAQTGLVTCESGVTLAELLEAFLPQGWFLAVTPGTRHITVGGAIASDVHGKNHHISGCFSEGVLSFELMLPDGRIMVCSREENRELFQATCGGMGLTGVILGTTLRLQPVASAFIRQTIIPCDNLETIFALFDEHRTTTYSVAWIDCLARNDHLGRSLLLLGEHADSGRLTLPSLKTRAIPLNLPGFLLNKYSVSLFNRLYYRRRAAVVKGELVPLSDFFYPLDRLEHWNRLYGRRGFTQYQLVLPKEVSFSGLTRILQKIARAGLGPFLSVLKLFGPANENPLSFPRAGYTLSLDFRIEPKLFPFLNELDQLVLDHGGRLYLAKDARMSGEVFRKSYPQWEHFAELREKWGLKPKLNSRQSKRIGA